MIMGNYGCTHSSCAGAVFERSGGKGMMKFWRWLEFSVTDNCTSGCFDMESEREVLYFVFGLWMFQLTCKQYSAINILVNIGLHWYLTHSTGDEIVHCINIKNTETRGSINRKR